MGSATGDSCEDERDAIRVALEQRISALEDDLVAEHTLNAILKGECQDAREEMQAMHVALNDAVASAAHSQHLLAHLTSENANLHGMVAQLHAQEMTVRARSRAAAQRIAVLSGERAVLEAARRNDRWLVADLEAVGGQGAMVDTLRGVIGRAESEIVLLAEDQEEEWVRGWA